MHKEALKTEEGTNKYLVQYYPNHYGKKIADLTNLANEAKKDFPSLTDEDLEVVVFGGDSKKYIHGIRFSVNTDKLPENMFFWNKEEDNQKELENRRYLLDSILN